MGVQCGHVGQGDQAGEGVVRGVRVIRLVSGWPGVFSVVRVIRLVRGWSGVSSVVRVIRLVRGVQCGHVGQGDQGGQASLVDWDGQCGHGSQGGHSLIRMVRMVIVFVVVRMIRLIRLVRLARLVRVVRGSVCNKLYCLLFRQQTQNTMTKSMPQLSTSSQLLPTALATR